MKASELIERLQRITKKYGEDMEIDLIIDFTESQDKHELQAQIEGPLDDVAVAPKHEKRIKLMHGV